MRGFDVRLALVERRSTRWEEPTDALRASGNGWRRAVQAALLRLARWFGATQYYEPRCEVKAVRLNFVAAAQSAIQGLQYLEQHFGARAAGIKYVLMGPEQFEQTAEELATLPYAYGLAGATGWLDYHGISIVCIPWMRGVLPVPEIKVHRCS